MWKLSMLCSAPPSPLASPVPSARRSMRPKHSACSPMSSWSRRARLVRTMTSRSSRNWCVPPRPWSSTDRRSSSVSARSWSSRSYARSTCACSASSSVWMATPLPLHRVARHPPPAHDGEPSNIPPPRGQLSGAAWPDHRCFSTYRRPVTGADSAFLRACRGAPVDRIPVWFMRQAGRSLPEYRAARGGGSVLDAIRRPELAAEITLQPVRRYGADLARLRPLDPEQDTPFVLETVRLVARELGAAVPVIGFAGAPFTVASYLVEGGASRTYAQTKRLMWSEPGLFAALLDALADMALASLVAQVQAGASAVQLFDSWVGALSPDDYARHVLPATRKVLDGLE